MAFSIVSAGNEKVKLGWDAGDMVITEAVIGNGASVELGVDDDGIDVIFYGATSGAKMTWDESANSLVFAGGATITGGGLTSYSLADTVDLEFGDGTDVTIQWDATNLIIAAAADDTLIEIGDSAETQLSFDLKWYGGTASGASYLYFDASADLIYTTGVDLQFKDSDVLVFGTGSGATGDVQMKWDGTNFIMSASADDSIIEIGDAAATQLSFDVKVYGDAANGADYALFDAGASKLTTAGAYTIAGRTGDANGIGLTLSVKTDAGDPGTTGTPVGSIVYNTNDHTINVFDGAGWLATAALS